jgi:hypothetical protein
MLALVALLYSAAAMAQQSPPPTVGNKPLVQVKPHGAAAPKAAAAPKNLPVAKKLQACLEIDDGTKDRLNCYDTVIPPKPNPKAKAPAKAVTECNAFKDEEERLTCFNGFVEKLPKLPS